MDYPKEVKEQYENYPYPFRDPEDEKTRLLATEDSYLDKINHYCYGGRKNFDNFRVLIAGGGTGSAAIFLAEQLRGRNNAEIVYLDLSSASMAVARKRAEIRGLSRITWVNNSILNLPELNLGPFDYINCVGVLHHLEDYYKGLKMLNGQLKDNGCMGVMVYGKHGRTAVYQMQELMRLVNTHEAVMQTKVENTKIILDSLPPANFFKRCEGDWLTEVEEYGDIGLYDLFLHSHDHGFDVLEIYDWVESCGLYLVDFIGPKFESRIGYEPKTFITHPGMLKKIGALPRRRQQAIAEITSGLIQRHSFYLSRRPDTEAKPDDLDNVPFFFRSTPQGLAETIDSNPGKTITLTSPDQISVQLAPSRFTSKFLRHLNDENSIKMIFAGIRRDIGAPHLSDTELLDEFRPLYKIFNDIGWMLLRHHSVAPFAHLASLQERVSKQYSAEAT
ncbi:MAG: class I SAM-dependent methyltransferase [Pseudomonadota bacterium]